MVHSSVIKLLEEKMTAAESLLAGSQVSATRAELSSVIASAKAHLTRALEEKITIADSELFSACPMATTKKTQLVSHIASARAYLERTAASGKQNAIDYYDISSDDDDDEDVGAASKASTRASSGSAEGLACISALSDDEIHGECKLYKSPVTPKDARDEDANYWNQRPKVLDGSFEELNTAYKATPVSMSSKQVLPRSFFSPAWWLEAQRVQQR